MTLSQTDVVSPWALIAASRVTFPAALSVSVGVAFLAAGGPLFAGFGWLLSTVGLIALVVSAVSAAWWAPRCRAPRTPVTSVELIVYAVVVTVPATIAALASPAATGLAAAALPMMLLLAGLSNRVPRAGLPAGRTIAALALAMVAVIATVRVITGELPAITSQLTAGTFAGFAAVCVATIVVALLAVVLRPGQHARQSARQQV